MKNRNRIHKENINGEILEMKNLDELLGKVSSIKYDRLKNLENKIEEIHQMNVGDIHQ